MIESICLPKQFTIAEADEMIPLLDRITAQHEVAIEHALADQRFLIKSGAPGTEIEKCTQRVTEHQTAWGRKLFKLGLMVFSGGFVGFDTGAFYLSWRYGDGPKILYYHGLGESPVYRRHIQQTLLNAGQKT